MYKFLFNNCLKVYLKRFSELVQMVSFNVCIILDRVMVSTSNVTNMRFLCPQLNPSVFPLNHEAEVSVKEEFTNAYI
jgi:hypothetical protein